MGISAIKTAEEKVLRGMIDLQKPQPFFAHLLMNMRPQLLPLCFPHQTMGVDAKGKLYYAEQWTMSLQDEEVMGALCHEALHVGLLHHLRVGRRNVEIANIAQDIVVNMPVVAAGLRLPKTFIAMDVYNDAATFTLLDVVMRIREVSKKPWEAVYDEIIQNLIQGGKNPDDVWRGGLGFDVHISGDGGEPLSDEELREVEKRWQQNLVDAAVYAQQRGILPAGMERLVEGLLRPKVQWRSQLMRYLRPFLNPVDWSYHKSSRKSQALGVYLPTTLKEQCDVEVIVDTSGSISKETLTEFLSEIIGIAMSMRHISLWVTFVDAAVHNRYKVDNGEIPKILNMSVTGGGGTELEVGLDFIKKNNPQVPLVIALTDGYDSYTRTQKDYPFDVIWVIAKNGSDKQPYGRIIRME